MSYRIKHSKKQRESFGEYNYDIYKNDRVIAEYWHDYRGDDHGIEFINGVEESWPVGRMIDFIVGGGPKPLELSEKAISYLDEKLCRNES